MKIRKEVRNAFIIGLIVLVSNLSVGGGIPTKEIIFSSILAGILAGLVELANSYGLMDRLNKITKNNEKKSKGSSFFL